MILRSLQSLFAGADDHVVPEFPGHGDTQAHQPVENGGVLGFPTLHIARPFGEMGFQNTPGQPFLTAEMEIDRPAGVPARTCDVADARTDVSVLFEQHGGRRQNSPPSDFRTFLHILGRPCSCVSDRLFR